MHAIISASRPTFGIKVILSALKLLNCHIFHCSLNFLGYWEISFRD
jgi:hypothetical protein